MRVLRSCVVVLNSLLVLGEAHASAGQEPSTVIVRGIVLDELRAPIVGARVTATADNATGPTPAIAGATSAMGAFALTLPPGRFVIRIAADGFREASQTVVASTTGSPALQFVLQVAGVRENVTVNAPSGYRVPSVTTATKTPTPLRRRAAVGHGRHAGADPRPDDDERRRRRALRARRHGAPGREQPRPDHHPRQQLVGRLLRRRRARRRAVLPRSLQPRSRRGAQGPQRHDLRPRRRRRRRQPRDARRPASRRCRELSLQGGMFGNKRVTGGPRPAARRQGGVPRERHVRELRQLPRSTSTSSATASRRR